MRQLQSRGQIHGRPSSFALVIVKFLLPALFISNNKHMHDVACMGKYVKLAVCHSKADFAAITQGHTYYHLLLQLLGAFAHQLSSGITAVMAETCTCAMCFP